MPLRDLYQECLEDVLDNAKEEGDYDKHTLADTCLRQKKAIDQLEAKVEKLEEEVASGAE